VQRVVPVDSLQSWGQIPTAMSSFVNYVPAPFVTPSTSVPQVVQQQPQTLTKSADFPELYIGPPRRGRGRPEGSTSSKSRTKSKREASSCSGRPDVPTPVSHETTAEAYVKGKEQTKPRYSRPQPQPTRPPFICAPLTRHPPAPYTHHDAYTIAHQTQPQTQPSVQPEPLPQPQYQNSGQNPLLTLLSAITSANAAAASTAVSPAHNTALLTALAQLLTANPQLLQSIPSACEPRSSDAPKQQDCIDVMDDGDSDIIILDSSTVDTAAFHKQGTSSTTASCSSAQGLETSTPSNTQHTSPSPMPASTPSSSQETPPPSPSRPSEITPTHSPTHEPQTPTPKRVPSKRYEEKCLPYNTGYVPTSPSPTKRSRSDYNRVQIPSVSAGREFSGSTPGTGPVSHKRTDSCPSERLPSMMSTIRKPFTSSPSSVTPRETVETTVLRKRTLGEFMAEYEARWQDGSKRRASSRRNTGRQHRAVLNICDLPCYFLTFLL